LEPDVGWGDVHIGGTEWSEKATAIGEQPPPGTFTGAIAPGQGIPAEQLNLGFDSDSCGVA